MVKKSKDAQLRDAIARAILRSLYFSEPTESEKLNAINTVAAVETMPINVQALSIRAAAAEYLRHAPDDLSFICTAMADALDGLDEGRWSGLFEPRSNGSINGWTPWAVEVREGLQQLFARAFIFSRALHKTDEAALAAIIGMNRIGAHFESKLLPPIIKMSGRSFAVARRLKDAGLKDISDKEKRSIIKAARGDGDDIKLQLEFSAWRSRFKNIDEAEAEWLEAGITKRAARKAKTKRPKV